MIETFSTLSPMVRWLVQASLEGGMLVAALLALRAILGPRFTPGWRTAAWAFVALRLVLPSGISSSWSVESAWRSVFAPAVDAPTPISDPTPHTTIVYGDIAPPPIAEPTPIAPARTPTVSLSSVLVVTWMAGALFFSAARLFALARLRRQTARMSPIQDPRVVDLVAAVASTMRYRRAVRIVASDTLRTPAIAGIVRPVLILPATLPTDAELRLILMHEFAHLRAGDPLRYALASIVRTLHWFNPLVWLAERAFREDRELACDRAVLDRLDASDRDGYGECLLNVVERVAHLPSSLAVSMAAGSKRSLRRRISSIAGYSIGSRWTRRIVGFVSLLFVGFAAITCAPTPSTERLSTTRPAGEVYTATYDVRDLLIEIPDFSPDVPTENGKTVYQTRDDRVAQLIGLIQESIDPPSWRPSGTVGHIQELGGQLIVTQTPTNHERVLALLSKLRDSRSVQVVLAARFIALDPRDVPTSIADQTSAYLDTAAAEELLKSLRAESTLTAPRMTLFNGQRGYVETSSKQSYVADIEKKTDENGATVYEPKIDDVKSGVRLDARPTASADFKYVTIDLKIWQGQLVFLRTLPFQGAPDRQDLKVQRPDVQTHEIETTISMPDRGTVVLRSPADPRVPIHVKDDGTVKLVSPGDKDAPKDLLVFITPTIIRQTAATKPVEAD